MWFEDVRFHKAIWVVIGYNVLTSATEFPSANMFAPRARCMYGVTDGTAKFTSTVVSL